MSKYQSDRPSCTWCVYFEVDDPPSRTYSGVDDAHYIQDKLRAIYAKINDKCSKTCKISIDKIIFT